MHQFLNAERGHSCPMALGFRPHPGGMLDNSPTLQRWVRGLRSAQVPKGRPRSRDPSAVTSGLILLLARVANVEALGYYHMSLRDKESLGTQPRRPYRGAIGNWLRTRMSALR